MPYKEDVPFFVCKSIRLCRYFSDNGFAYIQKRPDKERPEYNVWIFMNCQELWDCFMQYQLEKEKRNYN